MGRAEHPQGSRPPIGQTILVGPKLDAFAERASRGELLASRETARRRTVETGGRTARRHAVHRHPDRGPVGHGDRPDIITTAPTSFINVNHQVSPVGNVSGGQAARPMTEAG